MAKIKAVVLDNNAKNLDKRNLNNPLSSPGAQHLKRALMVG
jgi:hypothetical protein